MNWNFLTEKARFIYDGFNIQRIKYPSFKKFTLALNDFNVNIFEKKVYYSTSWDQLKNILLNFYSTLFVKDKQDGLKSYVKKFKHYF